MKDEQQLVEAVARAIHDALDLSDGLKLDLAMEGQWTEAAAAALSILKPKVKAMEEALDGYRAAVSYIGADSWDGCSDCIDTLKAARTNDLGWEWAGDPERIAAELKKLRRFKADIHTAALNGGPTNAGALDMCAHGADRGSYCGYCGGYSEGAKA